MVKPKSTNRKLTILFGVTNSQSLKLLGMVPRRMLERGWNVHVACDNRVGEAPRNLDGIALHHLPMERNPSPLHDIVSLLRWFALLQKVEPHIVAIGTPKAALLGILSSLLAGVPIRVYQLRGLRLETESGLKKWFLYFVEMFTARIATHIVAVSESLKNEYLKAGLSSKKGVTVLGLGSSHGVDTENFHPDRWSDWNPPYPHHRQNLEKPPLTIGFVGRFSGDKGADELLWCHQTLKKRGLDHRLLIIGPHETNEATQGNLNFSSIISVGPVHNIAPYYSLMDILVLPTHREGFPNVVLEAAASGIPTVTTNVTGAIDSVVHGVTGIIVPFGERMALVTAVEGLLVDEKRRIKLGENARAWAVRHFEESSVTESQADFLVDVWRTSRPR